MDVNHLRQLVESLTMGLDGSEEYTAGNYLLARDKYQGASEILESILNNAIEDEISKAGLKIQLCHYWEQLEKIDEHHLAEPKSPSKQHDQTCEIPDDDDLKLAKRIERFIVKIDEGGIKNICGLEQLKRELVENILLPRKQPGLFTGRIRPMTSFLLYGPPGNGKTMFAKAVASSCKDTTFFSISASALLSKWQGESEQLIRCLFETALRHGPSIIFIDEVDSLVLSREKEGGEGSRRIKTEIFIHMENALNTGKLVFLAATNRPYELDDAFLRRFDKLVYVPLPNEVARKEILHKRLIANNDGTDLTRNDIDKLVTMTQGLSFKEVEVMCDDAYMEVIRQLKLPDSAMSDDGPTLRLSTLILRKQDVFKVVRKARSRTDTTVISKIEKFDEKVNGTRLNEPLPPTSCFGECCNFICG